MTANIFITQTERKPLLVLILAITCIFYAHCFITVVEEHNEKVRLEQSEKLYSANTSASERFSFSACVFPPALYTQFFWIQFFTNPILYLLLRKSKPSTFLFSFFLLFITTFSLLTQIRRNYVDYILDDMYLLHNAPYGYFSLTTHISEIVLAILGGILLVVQFWITLRFALEKYQVKNSLT